MGLWSPVGNFCCYIYYFGNPHHLRSAFLSWWWDEEYEKLILLVCFVCVLLNGDSSLHLQYVFQRQGPEKGETCIPDQWIKKTGGKSCSLLILKTDVREGVYSWWDIFWQKAFFGETLIFQTQNVLRELTSFHQIFQYKWHNFVRRAAGEPKNRGGEYKASWPFPWSCVWNFKKSIRMVFASCETFVAQDFWGFILGGMFNALPPPLKNGKWLPAQLRNYYWSLLGDSRHLPALAVWKTAASRIVGMF